MESVSAPARSVAVSVQPTASAAALAPLGDKPATFVYRDDKRVIGTALAFTNGGSAVHVVVSTHQRFCDNIRGNKIVAQNYEVFLGATVAHQLDGKTGAWNDFIVANRFGNSIHVFNASRPGGEVKILSGTAAKDDTLELAIRTTADGATLDGVLSARGCGDLLVDRAPAPPGVVLTVAGKAHTIRSARVLGSGATRVLSLSTAPVGCGSEGELGDAVLTVKHGGGDHPRELHMGGDMYAHSRAEPSELANMRVKLVQDANTSDFTFELEGQAKIGDYTVSVNANGAAPECR